MLFFSWYQMIFFIINLFSAFFIFSMKNWFFIWILLEINTFSFIPLCFMFNKLSSNSSIKYFIIQSIASIIFLFSIFLMEINYYDYSNLFSTFSIFMKLGIFPFHNWWISVSYSIEWMSFFLISSLQKIIPIFLINMFYNYFCIFFAIISVFFSPLFLYKNNNFRFILVFSSISHISWICLIIFLKQNSWLFYFSIYSLMIFLISYLFYYSKFSAFQFIYMSSFNKIMLTVLLISLSGIPPFIGFLPKWIVIYYSNYYYFSGIFLLFLFSSFLFLFNYLKFLYPIFLFKTFNNKILVSSLFFMSFLLFFLYPIFLFF